MLEYLIFAAAAVHTAITVQYCRETLSGKIQPNRVSWLLWSLAPLIGGAAAIAEGVTLASIPMWVTGLNPMAVLICSFFNKKSYWHFGLFDYFCGFVSLSALCLWAITGNALNALYLSILADGIAFLPTIRKVWIKPESEMTLIYFSTIFLAGSSYFSFKTFGPEEYAFPLYLVLSNFLVGGMIVIRRRFTRISAHRRG